MFCLTYFDCFFCTTWLHSSSLTWALNHTLTCLLHSGFNYNGDVSDIVKKKKKCGVEQCGESSWKNPSIISTKHKDQYKYIQYMEQTSITIVFLLGDYWPLNQHLYSGSVLSLYCVITLIFSIKQLLNKYDLDRSLFPVLIFCTLAPGFILWCRCAKTMNWENLWDYIGIKKKKKKDFKIWKKVWILMSLPLNFLLSVA